MKILLIAASLFVLCMFIFSSSFLPLFAQDAAILEASDAQQIRAILHVYGDRIQRTERLVGDFVFWIENVPIYFCHGRMLSEKNRVHCTEFDPFFYHYRSGPLETLPSPAPLPRRRSSDFLDTLIG
jgi:hypothetical protein